MMLCISQSQIFHVSLHNFLYSVCLFAVHKHSDSFTGEEVTAELISLIQKPVAFSVSSLI